MTIGERIAELRRAAGLSQEQLAELLEVSRQAISKWEKGQTQPEADRLPRICAVLGITSDELLGMIERVPVQESAAEESVGDVDALVRASLYRRVFTLGGCATIAGLLVLSVGYLSTWEVYRHTLEFAIEHGLGYRSDVMYYARTMPLLAVFILGGILLAVGLALAVFGLCKGLKHTGKAGK